MDRISATAGSSDYPRPSGPTLSPNQLQPGDILLSRGVSKISDQIVAADRASYSHCALWSGSGIIEATLKDGISEHPPTGERDVYRYADLSPESAARVVANARRQVEGKYAVAEIHLLAVVFQKWWPFGRPRRSAASALLDLFGGKKLEKLSSWLQGAYGQKAPRVCSELVSLAYLEARCPIRVRPLDGRPPRPQVVEGEQQQPAPERQADPKTNAAPLGSDELEELHDELRRTLGGAASASAASGALEGLLWGDVAVDSETGEPIGVVTPGDLQFSPSLQFCGTLRAG
jgi:hypothetical protein